jgi:DNA-directed RNA polymerase specialized sigma24 family protein
MTSPANHLQPNPNQNTNRLPEELLEATETTEHARTLIKRLKPNERRALTLLALGYSYREICELTGWTYTKVNRCIAEGRARMRQQHPKPNAHRHQP